MRTTAAGIVICPATSRGNALAVVFQAYTDLGDDNHIHFHDILGRAYESVPNRSPEEADRNSLLLAFVRSKPQFFGVAPDASRGMAA